MIFHPLVNSPNAHDSEGQARSELASKKPTYVSYVADKRPAT